jgi:hypothetical protein
MRGFRSASPEMRATRFAAYLCLVRGRRCSTLLAIGVRARTRARTGAPMSFLRFSLYEARDLFIYIAYHEILGMALMRLGAHSTGLILLIAEYFLEALGLVFLIRVTFSHLKSRSKRRNPSTLLSLLKLAVTYLEDRSTPNKPRTRSVSSRSRELKLGRSHSDRILSTSSPRSIRKRESTNART